MKGDYTMSRLKGLLEGWTGKKEIARLERELANKEEERKYWTDQFSNAVDDCGVVTKQLHEAREKIKTLEMNLHSTEAQLSQIRHQLARERTALELYKSSRTAMVGIINEAAVKLGEEIEKSIA
jgi:septal ring factor EnvC (AmiA/AmiB activator)